MRPAREIRPSIPDAPELRLLLYCARSGLDRETAQQSRLLIQKNLDWTCVITTALRHRVTPLLYRNIRSLGEGAIPAVVLGLFKDRCLAIAGRNLLLAKELCRLLEVLRVHSIQAIPYKGPALAVAIYGALALREFGDMDILVRDRDYHRAQDCLRAEGYRLADSYEWESTFVRGGGMIAVDLHNRFTSPWFRCGLTFEKLSSRLVPVQLGDTKINTLSPVDTLLMLAIQIAKDAGGPYFELAKICDVAVLLQSCPNLDLSEVLRQAKVEGIARILLLSLQLSSNLLGIVPPPEFACHMPSDATFEELVEWAQQQLFEHHDRSLDYAGINRFHWLLRERIRDKFYPYLYRLGRNCEGARDASRLPGPLPWLYYFVQPVRLCWKYRRLVPIGKSRSGRRRGPRVERTALSTASRHEP